MAGVTGQRQNDDCTGKFGWIKIGSSHYFPFIIRKYNGHKMNFISSRIVETVFDKYLHHPFDGDTMRNCIGIKSVIIKHYDRYLLNYINHVHCDKMYDNWTFGMRNDVLLRVEDVQELFVFIKIFYDKTMYRTIHIRRQRCGFMKINNDRFLPYCIKWSRKYVPLFCLEGNLDIFKPYCVNVNNWNLTYLKYCCALLELPNWFFAGDSMPAVPFELAKITLPSNTVYEEYWPIIIPTSPDYIQPSFDSIDNNDDLSDTQGQSTSSDNQIPDDEYYNEDTQFHLNTDNENRRRAYFPASVGRPIWYPQPIRPRVQITGVVDLPSPLSSPELSSEENEHSNRRRYIHSDNKYKVQVTTLRDKTLFCVNVEPYVHTDYMVAVQDLVRQLFPNSSVNRCAYLLAFLEKPLYSGNYEQLAVLRANGELQNIAYVDELPFVKLFDLRVVLNELCSLVERDEQEFRRPPKKRQRSN